MKKALVGITIALLAMFVFAPVASARTVRLTRPEKQLLTLINKQRARHGLKALRVNGKLERAARSHSREMIDKDYFAHNSASGEMWSKRIIRFGYRQSGCTYWTAGENIAKGVLTGGTPKAIFKAWLSSPAHKQVMLCKKFRDVGLGRAKGDYSGTTGTIVFTLDCGRRILQ
jgi:uncharacterized protein YkwD